MLQGFRLASLLFAGAWFAIFVLDVVLSRGATGAAAALVIAAFSYGLYNVLGLLEGRR